MNALFVKQNINVVMDAAEAIVPETEIDELTIHHENLLLENLENITSTVGGSVIGPYIKHTNGESIDSSQFENRKTKEKKNV